MRSDIYQIHVCGGYNSREDFKDAVSYTSEFLKRHYVNSGDLGECFGFIYLPIEGKRWVAWLNEKLEVKYRLLSSIRADR